MSEFMRKAVFLSYASQDAEAARRICEALRAAGVEVWFDQSELRGGDSWDAKIRKQIKECALFVPVISAATQSRTEGYFRREWKLGVERTHDMADDQPFLFPIVIDETRDTDARVPEKFREVQWTRLPTGEATSAFCERVKRVLEGDRAVSGAVDRRPTATRPAMPLSRRRSSRVGWFAAAVVVVAAAAIAYFAWPGRPVSPATAPVSEARQLARRAFDPIKEGTPSREQLTTAEVLCNRALTLDPTDPEIWIVAAGIDLRFILTGHDPSAARREKAMSDAARAVGLAPDLFEARAIKANILATVAMTDAMRADAEAQLLALLKERPDDHTSLSLLAVLTRKADRFAESADYFERINSPGGAAWSYYYGEDFPRAEEATERSLKKGRSPSMIALKANLAEVYREDLAAACAIYREVSASALLEEGPAFNAVRLALHDRRPDEVLQILGALPMEYVSILNFSGPKALVTGKAHALAGRPEAARADWQVALRVVEKKLAEASNDPGLLRQKAEVLACLGESDAAATALALSMQLEGLPPGQVTRNNLAILLRLGHRDEVLAYLITTLHARATGWRQLHADARFAPDFDPLRSDPHFEALLRETLPDGAKPFPDQPAKHEKQMTDQS